VAELLAGFRSPSAFCAHTGTKIDSLVGWVRGRVRPGSATAARIAVRTGRDPGAVEALLLKIYDSGRERSAAEQAASDALAEVWRP
jgi:hypothetical protein